MPLRPVTSAKDTSAPGAIPPLPPSATTTMPLFGGPTNVFEGGLNDPVNEEIARAVYELYLLENGLTSELDFFNDAQKVSSYKVIIAQFLNARRDDPIIKRVLTGELRDWIARVADDADALNRKWSGPRVKTRAQWLADP